MSSIYDNYPAVRYVDEYDKDTDEQCVRCKGNCGFIGITGMWACKGFVPMTNADHIRRMSDEELAIFLCENVDCAFCESIKGDCTVGCKDRMLLWLKDPMEDAPHEE